MATFYLMVSGHGGTQGFGTLPVTNNSEFKFFVPMGQVLPYQPSEQLYQDFAAGKLDAVNAKVKNTYYAGKQVDDYAIWDLEDPKYVSGVIQLGSGASVVDISGTTEKNPIKFSNLLALAAEELGIKVGVDTMYVYFNACRT